MAPAHSSQYMAAQEDLPSQLLLGMETSEFPPKKRARQVRCTEHMADRENVSTAAVEIESPASRPEAMGNESPVDDYESHIATQVATSVLLDASPPLPTDDCAAQPTEEPLSNPTPDGCLVASETVAQEPSALSSASIDVNMPDGEIETHIGVQVATSVLLGESPSPPTTNTVGRLANQQVSGLMLQALPFSRIGDENVDRVASSLRSEATSDNESDGEIETHIGIQVATSVLLDESPSPPTTGRAGRSTAQQLWDPAIRAHDVSRAANGMVGEASSPLQIEATGESGSGGEDVTHIGVLVATSILLDETPPPPLHDSSRLAVEQPLSNRAPGSHDAVPSVQQRLVGPSESEPSLARQILDRQLETWREARRAAARQWRTSLRDRGPDRACG